MPGQTTAQPIPLSQDLVQLRTGEVTLANQCFFQRSVMCHICVFETALSLLQSKNQARPDHLGSYRTTDERWKMGKYITITMAATTSPIPIIITGSIAAVSDVSRVSMSESYKSAT